MPSPGPPTEPRGPPGGPGPSHGSLARPARGGAAAFWGRRGRDKMDPGPGSPGAPAAARSDGEVPSTSTSGAQEPGSEEVPLRGRGQPRAAVGPLPSAPLRGLSPSAGRGRPPASSRSRFVFIFLAKGRGGAPGEVPGVAVGCPWKRGWGRGMGAAEPPAGRARGPDCSWGEAPPAPGVPNVVLPYIPLPWCKKGCEICCSNVNGREKFKGFYASLFCKILS